MGAAAGFAVGLPVATFGGPSSGRVHFVPAAVVFVDPSHGVLGGSYQTGQYCSPACKPRNGTISLTSDGGRTWHVVARPARPVVSLNVFGGAVWARLGDGGTLRSSDGRRRWKPAIPPWWPGTSMCPIGYYVGINAGSSTWSLCTTEPGAGNQGKAVYRNEVGRGWVQVASTAIQGRSHGGISSYGYPIGIAGAESGGFGIIWESRGTLYVTRNGGRHWDGLPRVSKPELDFGTWASVLSRGVGFVILERSGRSRLIETTDAGRTWRIVHRWAGAA